MQVNLDPSASPAAGAQGAGGRQRLETLAKDLGLTSDDLVAARRSGQSLSDLATSKGISQDTLLSAVKDSIAADRQQEGKPALADDQLTAMAQKAVTRKPGHHGHHHHGGAPATPPADGDADSAPSPSGPNVVDTLV